MFAFLIQTPSIAQLDALAQKRDVAALTQFMENPGAKTANGRNPFDLVRTGGGYAMGQMGWHAYSLEPKDGTAKYVVFSTPILVEDAGELLFRVTPSGKLVFVPERDDFGMLLDDHNFDVSFNLLKHEISVTDKFRCYWHGSPKPHFLFRFSPTLTVSSVKVKGKDVPFAQAGGVVSVSGFKDGTVTVTYAGSLKKPGFARELGPKEATLSGSMWYPMIARRPTTYTMTIHGPAKWLALAQGNELSSKVIGDERVTTYRMDMPVTWISATTGPYRRVTTHINGIDFSTISADAKEDVMEEQNRRNAEVIGFYSGHFKPYPFRTWTTVMSDQFQEGVGALEAYSFATYPSGGLPFTDSHEPGHTWWGGLINNDYLGSIWNESFTDYSQIMFEKDQPFGNSWERHRAFNQPLGYDPIFDTASLAHSGQDVGQASVALGYVKGSYVLQVLEDEMGPDAFGRSLWEWQRRNPTRHIGSWEDFEKVVNLLSPQNLTWFFDEWVRGTGLPDWTLTDASWANGKLTGRVEFKGSAYRLDTDLLLEMADGHRSYVRVKIDPSKEGRFTVSSGQKPSLVALDPFRTIASKNVPPSMPLSIAGFRPQRVLVDTATPDYVKPLMGQLKRVDLKPDEPLANALVVGSPASNPMLVPLLKSVGVSVSGDTVTYDGTSVNLHEGGLLALVDLPGGKQCLIGLGTCSARPESGKARLVLFNKEGKMLRALTDPITTGPLAKRL